jgi:hypothetical protein
MIRVLTPAEVKEHEQDLIKFCKENNTEMYNYMHTIKSAKWRAAWDERHRIVHFVKQEKYLSKKRLMDFINQPDTDAMKEYMKKFGSRKKMKMTITTTPKR